VEGNILDMADTVKKKHRSIPRNRLIAVFFMAGYIEAWGRGIDTEDQKLNNSGKSMSATELRI
jgi:predicted HTH transcriptional regulator